MTGFFIYFVEEQVSTTGCCFRKKGNHTNLIVFIIHVYFYFKTK